MVPLTGLELARPASRRDSELREYLRSEYRSADAEWARSEALKAAARHRTHRPFRLFVRRSPNARGVPPLGPSKRPALAATDGGTLPSETSRLSAEKCPHDAMMPLGRDGPTFFARCLACGLLLIENLGHVYMLRPSAD